MRYLKALIALPIAITAIVIGPVSMPSPLSVQPGIDAPTVDGPIYASVAPVAMAIETKIDNTVMGTSAPIVNDSGSYRNRVTGPGVNVAVVGTYSDCTGKALVGSGGAYYDNCWPAPWILAHPPFFGAMNSWAIGTPITWWDGSGSPHTYHIIDSTVYPPGSTSDTVRVDGTLHLQVCTSNVKGSTIRVLNAA